MDMVIVTNPYLASNSDSSNSSDIAPPFNAGLNIVTLEQVLRFAAIYFVPPYDLAAVALQIEGVCTLRTSTYVWYVHGRN